MRHLFVVQKRLGQSRRSDSLSSLCKLLATTYLGLNVCTDFVIGPGGRRVARRAAAVALGKVLGQVLGRLRSGCAKVSNNE